MTRHRLLWVATALISAGLSPGWTGVAWAAPNEITAEKVVPRIQNCRAEYGDLPDLIQIRRLEDQICDFSGVPITRNGITVTYEADCISPYGAAEARTLCGGEGCGGGYEVATAITSVQVEVPEDFPLIVNSVQAVGLNFGFPDVDGISGPSTYQPDPQTTVATFGQGLGQNSNLSIQAPGGGIITRLFICAGAAVLPPDVGTSIPSCEDFVFANGVQVTCPSDGSAALDVITYLDAFGDIPDASQIQEQQCACPPVVDGEPVAGDVYEPCNDGKTPIGDIPQCFDPNAPPEEQEKQASIVIEFDPDPKTCTTINGKRKCSKCLDNPFTADNECAR